MDIMRNELSDQKKIFELSDNRRVSKSDICNEYEQSEGGGGGFNWEFIGVDANYSQRKAEKLCSSSSSEEDSKEIRDLFQREIGALQLQAFESCLNAFEANPEFKLVNHKLIALPGRGADGISKGQGGDYYQFSLTFVWDPNAIPGGTKQKLFVVKNPKSVFVDCNITPNNPAEEVVPEWNEVYFINIKQIYIYQCETVGRYSSPTLQFTIEGYPNTIEFEFDQ